MSKIQPYKNNLLAQHKQTMWLGINGLSMLALLGVGGIAWSFGRFRQATEQTYVFHRTGAAIGIYDQRTNPLTARLNPNNHRR